MRLIDADALNKRLSEMEAEISEDDCMPGDAFSDGIISAILDIKQCIQNQEIVYDVDKIIKELTYESSRWKESAEAYDDDMEKGVSIGLKKAIEIVKAGVVND